MEPETLNTLAHLIVTHFDVQVYMLNLVTQFPNLLNVQNKQGNTPLHIAASKNYGSLVKGMLELGANGSIKNADGKLAVELTSQKSIIVALNLRQKRKFEYIDDEEDSEDELFQDNENDEDYCEERQTKKARRSK